MSAIRAKGDTLGRKRSTWMTLGLGTFVTLIMVLSALSGAMPITVHAAVAPGSQEKAPLTTGPSELSASRAQRASEEAKIISTLKNDGVAPDHIFPPNLLGGGHQKGSIVSPTYAAAPAPMGIADYGLTNTTGTTVGSVTNTTSVKGVLNLNSLSPFSLTNDGPYEVSVQLNTVAANVTLLQNTSDQFWLQNVPVYSTDTDSLVMNDNIWNFSSPSGIMPNNTLQGDGYLDAPVFYYDVAPVGVVHMPFTIQLYNNVTTARPDRGGNPWDAYSTEVTFAYNVIKGGKSLYHATYDTIFFNSTLAARPTGTNTVKNQINGLDCSELSYPGFCLLLDAELVIGGEGDGSNQVYNNINATMSLYTENAGFPVTYTSVPSAFDYGTDTGETAVGVTEWWTTAGTVDLTTGPSFLTPLWDASGPVANSGDMSVKATVSPSNAFVFIQQGEQTTSTFDPTVAQFAALPTSGTTTYHLMPGNYTAQVLMSNYDPSSLTILNATSKVLTVTLASDRSTGIYTPLYAIGSQVQNISASGLGTLASPYKIFNVQTQSIWPEFNQFNDFMYPTFTGFLLINSSAYVDLASPAQFNMTYVGNWSTSASFDGAPATNQLGIQVFNSTNVSVWGGSGLTGWFSDNLAGMPTGNIIFWNVTDSLIGNNSFLNSGTTLSILVYNNGSVDSRNVIWGNSFYMNASALSSGEYQPIATDIFGSGNLVYNNIFDTNYTAYTPTYDIFTFNNENYHDAWNVSKQPSTNYTHMDGYNLTGNILGYSWQGGNYWDNWTCGSTPPYNNSGGITNGGDYLPLCGRLQSVGVTPSPASVAPGGTVSFTATPICSPSSCAGVTYSWNLTTASEGALNASTGSVVTFTAGASASGSVALFVNATLNGVTVRSLATKIAIVSLLSVSVSPSSAVVLTGGTTSPFSATPTCSGTCPSGTTYSWTINTPSMGTINSPTGSSTTFTAGQTWGEVALFVNATLGTVTKQSAPTIITINAATTSTLTGVTVTPMKATVDPGNTTNPFTATPSCTAVCPINVTYVWNLNLPSLGTVNTPTAPSTNVTAGSAAGVVDLFVNASLSGVTKMAGPIVITISSTSKSSELASVAVSPTSPSVPVGGTQAFTATITCTPGSCPTGTTYAWSLSNKLGSLSGSGASETFTAGSAAGSVVLYVNATLNGIQKGASTTITITSASTLASVTVTPSAPSVAVGAVQNFTASPACSATCPSGITYAWVLSSSDGNLSGSTGPTVTFTAGDSTGTLTLTVTATLSGASKSATASITVTSSTLTPTITSVAVTPGSPSVSTGSTVEFTATPACSTTCPSGIIYSWSLTNSSLGKLSGSGEWVNFTAASSTGKLAIFVNATLNGKTVQSQPVEITIASGKTSSNTGFLGLSGDLGYILIGLIVLIIAGALVALLLFRKKPGPAQAEESKPEEPSRPSESEKPEEEKPSSDEPSKTTSEEPAGEEPSSPPAEGGGQAEVDDKKGFSEENEPETPAESPETGAEPPIEPGGDSPE